MIYINNANQIEKAREDKDIDNFSALDLIDTTGYFVFAKTGVVGAPVLLLVVVI